MYINSCTHYGNGLDSKLPFQKIRNVQYSHKTVPSSTKSQQMYSAETSMNYTTTHLPRTYILEHQMYKYLNRLRGFNAKFASEIDCLLALVLLHTG